MASSLIKPEMGNMFVNRVQENICSISTFLEQLQGEHTDCTRDRTKWNSPTHVDGINLILLHTHTPMKSSLAMIGLLARH